jgi:hypothetical protein
MRSHDEQVGANGKRLVDDRPGRVACVRYKVGIDRSGAGTLDVVPSQALCRIRIPAAALDCQG